MTYLQQDLSLIASCVKKSNLCNKTILISGATGLIGSLIIKAILVANQEHQANVQIVALARNKDKVNEIFGEQVQSENLQFIYQDICQPILFEQNVDYIVHTANSTNSKYFITNPVETIDSIYSGSKTILEFAKSKKVSGLVYLSSMEVFGATDANKEVIFEQDLGYLDILNVRSSYSESKRLVECMCKSYAEQYGLNVKVARLAQTFGAGISKNENRVFAQFARSAIRGEDIVLHTKGDSMGNYCYTTDVIKAIILLLQKGEKGQSYTVVNENSSMTIYQMAELVAKEIANDKIKVIYDIPKENCFGYAPKTTMRLSSQKLRELGWEPSVGLKESYIRLMEGLI